MSSVQLTPEDIQEFKRYLRTVINTNEAQVRAEYSEYFASAAGRIYTNFSTKWKELQELFTKIIEDFDLLNLQNTDTIYRIQELLNLHRGNTESLSSLIANSFSIVVDLVRTLKTCTIKF